MLEPLDYEVIGEWAQVLEINLEPGHTLIADGGSLLYADREISLETRPNDGADEINTEDEPLEDDAFEDPEETPSMAEVFEDDFDESDQEGSLLEKLFQATRKAIGKVGPAIVKKPEGFEDGDQIVPEDEEPPLPEEEPVSTEPSWFITHCTNQSEYVRKVAFTTAHSGLVLRLNLTDLVDQELIVQTGTFLCARQGTRLEKYRDSQESITFTRERFFNLDRIRGSEVFLQVEGQILEKELENDAIRVNLFSLIAFESTLEAEIEDIKRVESMRHEEMSQFILLAGTGRYWLQAATLQQMVHRISPFVFEPPLDENEAGGADPTPADEPYGGEDDDDDAEAQALLDEIDKD